MVVKKKKVSDKKPIKKTSRTWKTKKVVKKTTDEKVVKKKKVSKTKVKEKEIAKKSSRKKKSPQKKWAEVRKTNKERKTFLNLMKIEKAKLNWIAKINQIDENTLFILKNIFNEK